MDTAADTLYDDAMKSKEMWAGKDNHVLDTSEIIMGGSGNLCASKSWITSPPICSAIDMITKHGHVKLLVEGKLCQMTGPSSFGVVTIRYWKYYKPRRRD